MFLKTCGTKPEGLQQAAAPGDSAKHIVVCIDEEQLARHMQADNAGVRTLKYIACASMIMTVALLVGGAIAVTVLWSQGVDGDYGGAQPVRRAALRVPDDVAAPNVKARIILDNRAWWFPTVAPHQRSIDLVAVTGDAHIKLDHPDAESKPHHAQTDVDASQDIIEEVDTIYGDLMDIDGKGETVTHRGEMGKQGRLVLSDQDANSPNKDDQTNARRPEQIKDIGQPIGELGMKFLIPYNERSESSASSSSSLDDHQHSSLSSASSIADISANTDLDNQPRFIPSVINMPPGDSLPHAVPGDSPAGISDKLYRSSVAGHQETRINPPAISPDKDLDDQPSLAQPSLIETSQSKTYYSSADWMPLLGALVYGRK